MILGALEPKNGDHRKKKDFVKNKKKHSKHKEKVFFGLKSYFMYKNTHIGQFWAQRVALALRYEHKLKNAEISLKNILVFQFNSDKKKFSARLCIFMRLTTPRRDF